MRAAASQRARPPPRPCAPPPRGLEGGASRWQRRTLTVASTSCWRCWALPTCATTPRTSSPLPRSAATAASTFSCRLKPEQQERRVVPCVAALPGRALPAGCLSEAVGKAPGSRPRQWPAVGQRPTAPGCPLLPCSATPQAHLEQIMTDAPSLARRSAVARPMPACRGDGSTSLPMHPGV